MILQKFPFDTTKFIHLAILKKRFRPYIHLGGDWNDTIAYGAGSSTSHEILAKR